MVRELQTIKELGFNLLRKHAKIEPQRWYYHCDKLGLIVWQDMVNGGGPYKLWFVTYLTNVFQPLLRRLPDAGPAGPRNGSGQGRICPGAGSYGKGPAVPPLRGLLGALQ